MQADTETAHFTTDWAAALTDAVNTDNEQPERTCTSAASYDLLVSGPPEFQAHAALALSDFQRAGAAPLHTLRSDTVASRFKVNAQDDRANLLVARMTVPGGPWPGHFGLEAILFTAHRAHLPIWFPKIETPYSLDFGTVTAASNGFMRGQGAVLFPELLALRKPLGRQSFGVVFADRLAHLYATRVLPVLEDLRISTRASHADLPELRRLAFLAHEWGHLTAPVPSETMVRARRRRLVAVISELHADLAGITMLLEANSSAAAQAAEIILLDRIVREAWLPRAHAQVDSIAARHLLTLLRDTTYIERTPRGLTLRIDRVGERLYQELDRLTEIEQELARDQARPATAYLTDYGWRFEAAGYHIDLSDEISALLGSQARRASHALTPRRPRSPARQ